MNQETESSLEYHFLYLLPKTIQSQSEVETFLGPGKPFSQLKSSLS